MNLRLTFSSLLSLAFFGSASAAGVVSAAGAASSPSAPVEVVFVEPLPVGTAAGTSVRVRARDNTCDYYGTLQYGDRDAPYPATRIAWAFGDRKPMMLSVITKECVDFEHAGHVKVTPTHYNVYLGAYPDRLPGNIEMLEQ
jgi:hypothetical protein